MISNPKLKRKNGKSSGSKKLTLSRNIKQEQHPELNIYVESTIPGFFERRNKVFS